MLRRHSGRIRQHLTLRWVEPGNHTGSRKTIEFNGAKFLSSVNDSLYVYGEDGLTLWALLHRRRELLSACGVDSTESSDFRFYYRPSFGRGGPLRKQLGEFDFIVSCPGLVILGESKWHRNEDVEADREGILRLDPRQISRHQLFCYWCRAWWEGGRHNWRVWQIKAQSYLKTEGIVVPVPKANSRVFSNLSYLLTDIEKHGNRCCPTFSNLLLYFYDNNDVEYLKRKSLPKRTEQDFNLLLMDYSASMHGTFVAVDTPLFCNLGLLL